MGIHSGTTLHISDHHYLSAQLKGRTIRVLKCSQACIKRLEELEQKGYLPYKAVVRFVVAWKGDEDDEECAILLPDVYLKK